MSRAARRTGKGGAVKRLVGLVACVTLVTAAAATSGGSASGADDSTLKDVVTGRLKPAQIKTVGARGQKTVARRTPWISSGTLAAVQDSLVIGAADERLEAADAPPLVQLHGRAPMPRSLGCLRTSRRNVRV